LPLSPSLSLLACKNPVQPKALHLNRVTLEGKTPSPICSYHCRSNT
jgi:hypothetical protein